MTPEDTKKCAASMIAKGFPGLGKSYVVAIPMASIGPITVIAFGIGDNAGWAAYPCDPERKCLPVKLSAPTKWGKRMAERQQKACSETTTSGSPSRTEAGADRARALSLNEREERYPHQTRALRNIRIQGPSSLPVAGRQEFCDGAEDALGMRHQDASRGRRAW